MAALVLLTVVFRTITVGRWTWVDDDWIFFHDAKSMGFGSYLFQAYNGHLLPGGFLLSWVITTISPLSHGVAVLVIVLMAVAGVLAWAAAFREIFGERARLLVPLAILVLTPLAVRPTIWWTAAVLMLPLQVFTGLAVLFAARWARSRQPGSLLVVLVTLLAALFFWEKAVLIAVPVAGVVLFSSRTGLRRTLRDAWPLVLGGAVLVGGYLALYEMRTAAADSRRPPDVSLSNWPGIGTALDFYRDALSHTLAPALLGGPWGSTPVARDPLVEPGASTTVISCAVVLVLVVVSMYFRRRAWVALGMFAGYALVAVSLVLFSSRLAVYGILAIHDERYTVDTVMIGALAMAMVMTPQRDEPPEAAWRRTPPAWVRGRWPLPVLAMVVVASLVVGNVLVAGRSGTNPARAWVRNLVAGVDQRAPVALYDAQAPVALGLPPGRPGLLSQMLSPLGDKVTFDGPTENLLVPDGRGRLRSAVVAPAVHAVPGPVKGCGYALEPGQEQQIPLGGRLFDYHWAVQLTAYAGIGAILEVDIDGRHVQMQIDRGFARHQFGFVGPVDDVRLRLLPGSKPICVTDLIIGPARPDKAG